MEILLVEDHLPTAHSITRVLHHKYRVSHVVSCVEAEQKLQDRRFDAILLDLNLTDGSSVHLCQQDEHDAPPVIVVSGKCDLRTRLYALELGADDYITKPFSAPELLARLNAVLRRTRPAAVQNQTIGELSFSRKDSTVSFFGVTSSLTLAEREVLSKLLRSPDHIIPKENILNESAQHQNTTLNTVEAHIRSIRKKIGVTKKHKIIETVYGVGYRLNSGYAKSNVSTP